MSYQQHERDYTMLVTSIAWTAILGDDLFRYFSYRPSPGYTLIDDGILYHFMEGDDSLYRSKNWIEKYGNLRKAQKQVEQYELLVANYRKFISQIGRSGAKEDLSVLHTYFEEVMPMFLASIEVPEYEKREEYAQVVKLMLEMRKKHDDIYKIGIDVQRELLKCLEDEYRIESDTLGYMSKLESEKFIKSNYIPKDLKRRAKFVLLRHMHDKEEFFYDRKALEQFKLPYHDGSFGDTTDFSGKVAYKGIARGIAKIVRLVSDIAKIEEGDVLVTAMTDPRYLHAMKKAAAIVTNEGGITCHAAIIARELKVPCIIGTKIATQVLKDGDIVEVDANKGIIKVIK